MLTEVQPSFQEDKTIITMTVLGRRTEDVDEFIEKLEATGAFDDVLPKQSDQTDEGLDARADHGASYRGEPSSCAGVAGGESRRPARRGRGHDDRRPPDRRRAPPRRLADRRRP